jgi:hypothetical protein
MSPSAKVTADPFLLGTDHRMTVVNVFTDKLNNLVAQIAQKCGQVLVVWYSDICVQKGEWDGLLVAGLLGEF